MRNHRIILIMVALGVLGMAASAVAKDARLRIRVHPSQAYIYVDGVAKGGASLSGDRLLLLRHMSPGEHTVDIYNYGYVPVSEKVTVAEGQTHNLNVTMQPVPGTVSGPFGRIQIEGGGHAAVLLNGTTPEFTVGEADEFNHNIIWKQQLLVPAGTHKLTLLRGTETVWSGPVDVPAGKRVIVDVRSGGAQRTTDWPEASKYNSSPRFTAGIASATVALGPVSGQLFG